MRDGTEAPPPFGSGLAGGLWRATFGLLAFAGILLLGAVVSILARQAGWGTLVLFGYAWLGAALAMLTWSASLVLAAFGLGAVPRPVLALGGILCVLASALAALSLRSTGEPTMVGAVLVATVGGAVAAVVAWLRMPPPWSAPRGREPHPPSPPSPP